MVNEKILDLMHRVSELPDDTIAFDLMRYAPNVNLLLDFVVCVCVPFCCLSKVEKSCVRYLNAVILVARQTQLFTIRVEKLGP